MFPSWSKRVLNARGVFILYGVYCLLNAIIIRSVGPTLALDDVKLNIVTQSLQAGYLPGNPPLYEWLLIGAQQIAGPGLTAVLIVKYGLIWASGAFGYFLAKELNHDRHWAALSAFSMVLLYQFGWNAHQAFTHTLALIAATLFFWWTVLRLFRVQRPQDYLLLGVALGVGLLSKYSFIGVAIIVAVCLLRRSESRARLLSPWLLASVAVAALIALPHLNWLMAQNSAIVEATTSRLQGDTAPHWRRVLDGIPTAIWSIGAFFLPFALGLAVLLRGRARFLADAHCNQTLALLVMRDATVTGAIALLLGVIVIGVSSLQERYVIAFLLSGMFWVVGKWRNATPEPANVKDMSRYIIGIAVFALVILGVRIIQTAVPGKPFCSSCRQWIPYEAVSDALIDQGFDGGTLIGYTDHTAGNLRRLFPEARVLSLHMPFYQPPHRSNSATIEGQCFFIWSDELGPPEPQSIIEKLDPATIHTVIGEWHHPRRPVGWRKTEWKIVKIEMNHSPIRGLCRLGG